MVWVVAMLPADMARDAKVVIVAHGAGDELGLIEDWTERLASCPEIEPEVSHLERIDCKCG